MTLMRQLSKLKHIASSGSNCANGSRQNGKGMDVGLEIGLCLVEQLKNLIDKESAFDTFFDMVMSLTGTEALLIVESQGDEARVRFTNLKLSPQVRKDLCKEGGFYFMLANIRFAHLYHVGSLELADSLPKAHPRIENLLAVPITWRGRNRGCLVVLNRAKESFDQNDAMILALSAAVLSFVVDFSPWKENLKADR